ncbi:MAG: SCP2 sterol-binding domain-containing protein [Gammaproteobacteria bacterium]|nr:SCP2 sterol-binding domain-containing protein [Gammaproteobacteria bacterium]
MLEAQINGYLARALERSPRARELCRALEGRRIRFEIAWLPAPLALTAAGGALHIARADTSAAGKAPGEGAASAPAAADVTVTGSPIALLALARGDTDAAFGHSGAGMSGDEDVARQFQELARLLRPDPEAAAGQLLGRIPAHLAARAFGALADWGRAAGASLARNGADYLAHESRDLVPRAEGEQFLAGVEALRTQVGAAEARLARLAARLEALAPASAAPRSDRP